MKHLLYSSALCCSTLLLINCGGGKGSGGSNPLFNISHTVVDTTSTSSSSGNANLDMAAFKLLDSPNANPNSQGFSGSLTYQMSMSGCVSGRTATCTNSSSMQAYLGDRGCLIKMDLFTSGGNTYVPSAACSSISWQPGSQCAYVNSKNSSDSITVTVLQQLSNPTLTTDAVSFELGDVGVGTAQTFAASTLGFGANTSVLEQQDPNFQISGLIYYGINSNGSGNFAFNLACADKMTVDSSNSSQGLTLCDGQSLSTMDYALVAYPSSGSLTASVLESLMNSSSIYKITWQGASDSSASDKLSAGKGGFKTKIMAGPGKISSVSSMLLILRDTTSVLNGSASIKSYRSFQVNLESLASCNSGNGNGNGNGGDSGCGS